MKSHQTHTNSSEHAHTHQDMQQTHETHQNASNTCQNTPSYTQNSLGNLHYCVQKQEKTRPGVGGFAPSAFLRAKTREKLARVRCFAARTHPKHTRNTLKHMETRKATQKHTRPHKNTPEHTKNTSKHAKSTLGRAKTYHNTPKRGQTLQNHFKPTSKTHHNHIKTQHNASKPTNAKTTRKHTHTGNHSMGGATLRIS